MLGKAGMDSPTNTPREDSPASGPSPEVQVPGKNVARDYVVVHPDDFPAGAKIPEFIYPPESFGHPVRVVVSRSIPPGVRA